jgi:hypothetical protein
MSEKDRQSQAVLFTEFVSLGAYPGGSSVRVSMRHNGKIERHSSWKHNEFPEGLDWENPAHRGIAGITNNKAINLHDAIDLWLNEDAIEHFKKLSGQLKKAYAKFQAKGGLEAQARKHEIGVRLRRIKKNLIACYEEGMTDEHFDEFVEEVKAEALLKS